MTQAVVPLPRGGLYVRTSAGAIQFGIPPETIKDSMALGLEVPAVYVVPATLFDRRRGFNVAEAEFPAYYNYFVLKRRVRLVVEDAAHEARVRAVFQESLFGPKAPPRDGEFADDFPPARRPDFARESDHFRRGPNGARIEVDTLVEFVRVGADGRAKVGEEVTLARTDGGGWVVIDGGREVARAPGRVELPERRAPRSTPGAPFEPPEFGVTILGASHGFDPHGKTTGFILWIGRRGIFIDPPGDATEHLREHGVPPKLVDGIVLTHCHADHDSGTFQKILEEGKVTLYTTPTILGSFLRKYSTLSGLGEDLLRRTFTYCPVKIGAPLRVNGGELSFFYTLHSIPTIGLEVFYGGKSLAFSSDSLYDPKRIEELRAAGVITRERADGLVAFPWHHTIVLHEAGVPPLHTPASVLATLPDDVKRRLFLVHIADKDVPKDQGLQVADVGLEHTLRIDVHPPEHKDAIELLDAFGAVELFRDVPFSRAREMLLLAERVRYPKGASILEKGSPGETFYLIVSGVVSVRPDDGDEPKTYRAGDYFGETALLLGQPRNADVIAKTDVELVELDRHAFLYLLRGTDVPRRLERLARMRAERSWDVFEQNSVVAALSSTQKTQLQSYLETRQVHDGETLWRAGDGAVEAFLVDDAAITLEGASDHLEPFGAGAFLGEFDAIRNGQPLATTARVVQPGRVFRIGREDLGRFFSDNPGPLLAFLGARFVE